MWQMLALAAILVSATRAAAETPWPLKAPAELKDLHGPTFTGVQILTYRHAIEPPKAGMAPETVIGIGRRAWLAWEMGMANPGRSADANPWRGFPLSPKNATYAD